jgi:hypothetical protein
LLIQVLGYAYKFVVEQLHTIMCMIFAFVCLQQCARYDIQSDCVLKMVVHGPCHYAVASTAEVDLIEFLSAGPFPKSSVGKGHGFLTARVNL